MKSIRKELLRNNLILILSACIFLVCNLLLYSFVVWQDNRLLQDYQQIHEIVLINNERKTNFKLYCKSHEDSLLQDYYNSCERLNQQLQGLSDKMQDDNGCKMMYRLVCQVVEHSQETAEQYMNPTDLYNAGILTYLDEVDLELERCVNQLTNYYLEYLNQAFASYSDVLRMIVVITNGVLIAGCVYLIKQNRQIHGNVLKSIEKLSEAAQEITNKNFETADIEEMSFLELNHVSGTFDHMKHTIRDMIVEINEKHQMKEYLAEAKIRELQMQMNPHFLFNTLNLVVRNIQLGERDISIQLIKAISQILRSSIEIKSLAIPLDDEIELLQAYLFIQKLHMRGRVEFYLDVRKSFGDKEFKIPPLTIQPLVENCVQHGLKDKVSDGKVEILITEKMDYMEVVVADNGVGFQKKEEVAKPAGSSVTETKTSIGLNNVKQRLKLYYQKDDVVKIERIDGITKITLKLYKTNG